MPIDVLTTVTLTEDETDDILYLARIGDVNDFSQTLTELTQTGDLRPDAILQAAVDSVTGNTCLHYASANGHTDMVSYLTRPERDNAGHASQRQVKWMVKGNASGNTALHYAALNGHLDVIKALLAALESHRSAAVTNAQNGQGQENVEQITEEYARLKADFVARKNNAGLDAAYEAETNGKEDVVNFLLGVMDEADAAKGGADESKIGEETEELVGDETETVSGASVNRNGDAQDAAEKTKDLSIA